MLNFSVAVKGEIEHCFFPKHCVLVPFACHSKFGEINPRCLINMTMKPIQGKLFLLFHSVFISCKAFISVALQTRDNERVCGQIVHDL